NRNSPGGSFTMNANSNLLVGGNAGGAGVNNNFPNNFGTYAFNPTSTTSYTSSSLQGIFGGVNYGNLVIDGSLEKRAPAALNIAGNFTKSGDSEFKHEDGTVTFIGTGGQAFSNLSGFPIVFNKLSNASSGT